MIAKKKSQEHVWSYTNSLLLSQSILDLYIISTPSGAYNIINKHQTGEKRLARLETRVIVYTYDLSRVGTENDGKEKQH